MTVADAANPEAIQASTIVVVDDEPTTLDMIEIFLEDEGYGQVVKVSDASRALETIYDENADLVLLDLVMPEMDGIEILRIIREDDRLRSLPVVIVSSTSDHEAKAEALALGATEFLAKPVDPSELALRVRNALIYKAFEKRFGTLDGENGQQLAKRIDRALRGSEPAVQSRLAGDPRYRKTIARFVSRLDEKLEWMEVRLEAEEFEELAALAHWLKGSAAMVGFDAFVGPADTLEILAKEGKSESASAALRELHGLAARIVVSPEGGK